MASDAIDAVQANETPATAKVAKAAASDAQGADKGARRKLAARGDSKEVKAQLYPVEVDHSRDALLTDF
ncbi:MAG: hypothetical protein V4475_14255, partial [Pseudomonadota bacterium]